MPIQNKFTVTQELLAPPIQRFLNLLVDTIVQLVFFFGILVSIQSFLKPDLSKVFIAHVIINPIGQYTFVSAITLLYYNVFEALTARTLGKYITKTIVVDENGEKTNHETILIRTLCRLIPFNAFSFLGISGRGWHDTISKTYVVNKTLLDEKKRLFYAIDSTSNETE
jgi:uncharacterized RDD family membrane protein YckC